MNYRVSLLELITPQRTMSALLEFPNNKRLIVKHLQRIDVMTFYAFCLPQQSLVLMDPYLACQEDPWGFYQRQDHVTQLNLLNWVIEQMTPAYDMANLPCMWKIEGP